MPCTNLFADGYCLYFLWGDILPFLHPHFIFEKVRVSLLHVHVRTTTCSKQFCQYCEVAAGTDIVKKSLAAFTVPTVATTILVDGMAYDGFPGLAALEDTCLGNLPQKQKSIMQS